MVATACGGGFSSDDPCNIVNRLGVEGIQIEQGKVICEGHWKDIAQAVVDAIGPRITLNEMNLSLRLTVIVTELMVALK